MACILIIEDDPMFGAMLKDQVERFGHAPVVATTIEEGLEAALTSDVDLVLLDVQLPDGNGLKAIPRIREGRAQPEVIIITGHGAPDGSELAIKSGAWDYIEKHASLKKITLSLDRALRYREEKAAVGQRVVLKCREIVGRSARMASCLDLAAQVAAGDGNILITGETGTGKELFAQTIHRNSRRAENSFVVVDCAALPETLVEGLLFGHKKGAFTGAEGEQIGLIKAADGGTLFLDEIGELPLRIQKTFLRVLQERRFRALGATGEEKSDFRLIAATNRDLEQMVDSGQFRRDLFFRLQTLVVNVPPLRERPEDIKELTIHYLVTLCERYGREIKGISPDFTEALQSYSWPGNVRELIHTMEWALTIAGADPTLYASHLPTPIRVEAARSGLIDKSPRPAWTCNTEKLDDQPPTLKAFRAQLLADGEKKYFQHLLSITDGDIDQACELSGLGRSRLYGLLKSHGLTRSE